ncbi:hypothetical protein [Candidatus Palauibacter sp.]|uniref:hypothetical protein n=1 Tax=Candidatus Palauibacter sp. TaxID=3101350 RepID=UPI003AF2BA86
MMNRLALALIVVTAVGFMVGCSDLFDPDDEVVAAIVIPTGVDTIRISVPDTVTVWKSFPVTIRTYHGCLLEKGRTQVDIRDLRATIVPYQRYFGPGNCPDFLAECDRTVYVRFKSRGLGSVTVIGLGAIKHPGEQTDTIRVVRTVVVK